MDETPRQRLARLVAGMPANSSPMPNYAVGANPNVTPMPNAATAGAIPPSQMPNFAEPGGSSASLPPMKLPQAPAAARNPFDFLPPYTGLRNEKRMTLPAFEQPGGSLPMDRYMTAAQSPTPQPAPAPALPSITVAPVSGGQGWGGPEPAPGTMPELQNQPVEIDPRYLPEQWRGSFNGWWKS